MEQDNNLNISTLEEKEFNRNKWFFSIGGIGRDMVYGLVANYFFMYVQFGLTLSVAQFATLSILIGVLGRIWDGINDPLMGTIIDSSHFRWGKFKPWIFFGAILTGILLLFMFNLRPFGTQDVYGWIYVGLMTVIYLLWEAAFTMNDIGYWGAIPSLSKDKKKRDQLTSMVIFFAGIGSGGIGVLIGLFSPGNILTAYTLYSIIACVAIIAFQTMVVMKVKEGKVEEKKEEKGSLKKTFEIIFKNKQLLWASLGLLVYDIGSGILGALIYNLYYLEYGYDGNFVVVMTGMGVVTMILQALYPKITKNLTRKKIQWYSFISMTIGYILIACIGWFNFLPFTPLTLSIGYFFIGVGGAYFYITSLINMTNCVEYNEYLTGERNEAVVSAVRPLIVKFGTATKSLLTTIILIGSGLYMLSQNVSNLETQKNLINDRVVKLVNQESIEDIKLYVTKINEYSLLIEGLDSDSKEYKDAISKIEEDIDSLDNDVMKRTQTNAEYIHIYEEMYILRYTSGTLSDYAQIKEFDEYKLNTFFLEDGYTYEASFVFDYYDENGNKVSINIANDVYRESRSLDTRIFLRVMVTVLPIVIALLSYYIQNKKFIVNEEYYDNMIKEIENRKINN